MNVAVITGTGRAFSTGRDVGKFADYAANTAADIKARLTENVQRLALKVQEIDKPVIAAVNALQTQVSDRVSVCFEERAGGSKLPQFRRSAT